MGHETPRATHEAVMGMSYCFLLLDQSDRLYRLPMARFNRMLTDPTTERLPRFAGQRVRAVGVHVQRVDRRPTAVVRASFHVLSFDKAGYFNASAYEQQELSRAEVALAPARGALRPVRSRSTVVDGTTWFAARGGRAGRRRRR